MTRSSVRQKILALVRRQGSVTSADAARALQVGGADARHHLAGMVADGLLEVSGVRMPLGGRGRPQKQFRLRRMSAGDGLAGLVEALLAGKTPEQLEQGWGELASRLAAGNQAVAEKNPVRRLGLAVEHLNHLQYDARWEAHAGGPQVVLGNCPYWRVIGNQPGLCRMDAALLRALLGETVEQVAKLEQDERGNAHCVFRRG